MSYPAYSGLIAIVLCMITAISTVVALLAIYWKEPKRERLFGIAAAISCVVSYIGYYHVRMIQSGGTFSDYRVVIITLVYVVALIISATLTIDGQRRLKSSKI